ncbi:MAG: G-D-S-L family lipolytic protein [Chitinophagaceae bacterium]|nr:G-D-S-L family lipolytic protein [Chitinophagaceae bacterium]MBP9103179.1 G-D-S-L family lipolytic protein [Chitinophagaceae bacterium]
MVKLVKIFLLVCFVIGITDVGAQPFSNEIATFKKQDAVSFPEKQEILFVGSSSFRMWKDVQTAFPNHTIINRGFGGSSLPDVIRYADEIIFPYQPKQIVIYCGENDIASSDTVTGEMTRDRFKILFEMIRNKLPDVPVVFVSIKPSPSRWTMQDRMITANKLIKKYLKKQKDTKYVGVWKPMLGKDGKPLPDIFLKDNLHMNAKGYAIWQKLIEPYLLK